MFRRLARDLLRFGMVGGLGLLVDVGLFNLLLLTTLGQAPVLAKTISVLAAIATNWAGNRWWAFRDRRGAHAAREALAFLLISLGGSAISLGCLGLTHYAFGFTSPLADNVSANIVGLAIGSGFRFMAVRTWLFRHPTATATAPQGVLVVTGGHRYGSVDRQGGRSPGSGGHRHPRADHLSVNREPGPRRPVVSTAPLRGSRARPSGGR